ncbi:MAG: DegQ family serine endoprotease [Hydrogenophilaceae bacterium]|nr:DegQ family serine endoprotease [Hydrogenophilaceae bacterium]
MQKWLWLSVCLFNLAWPARAADLPDFSEIVDKQGAAVVNITTTQEARRSARQGTPGHDEMFEFFRRFMPPEGRGFMPPRQGQGSGFILSGDGYIMTNAHVVDEADEVVVKLNDRREFRAKVIGADKRTDIALIKIEAQNLPKVAIGDPDKLRVGEWVLAIGAPFGFENSATAGIVSAKGRSLPQENYVPFIQTDVAVNPGNSGGPLFNLKGEVVGVNSQIISRSGGYMGLSFAIPIDVAVDVAEQLKGKGKINRGRLGVLIQEVTADLAESYGLDKPRGALIADVEPDSPAEKAGLQSGDIVLGFDGKPVNNSIDLPRLVGATKPGSRVKLQVWRKGQTKDVPITVAELVDDKVAADASGKQANRAGLVVSELTVEQKRQLGIKAGVLVEDVTGAAARAGIQPGDIILAVSSRPVNSARELSQLLNQAGRKIVALQVKRGEGVLIVPLRLEP